MWRSAALSIRTVAAISLPRKLCTCTHLVTRIELQVKLVDKELRSVKVPCIAHQVQTGGSMLRKTLSIGTHDNMSTHAGYFGRVRASFSKKTH